MVLLWPFLISAIWTALGWVFRVVVVKAMLYGVLAFFASEGVAYLISKMGATSVDGLGGAINALAPGMLWFMVIFRLDVGIPLVLAAYVTAFCIRRLPIIG